jgi:capsular exopolysaccharide synthesis family protein
MNDIANVSLGGGRSGLASPAADRPAFGIGETMLTPLLIKGWELAFRWRWVIGAIFAACIAIAVVLVMLAPSLYSAQSQIEISREKKNVTNVRGLDADESSGYEEFYDTQYQLLRAGSLAERVVRSLKLADEPGFFAAHGIDVGAEKAPLSAAQRKQREAMAAGLLKGGIQITPIRNSSLVNIGYTSQSPQWSARIANAWPQGFVAETIDRGLSSTADARTFLESRLEDLRIKLARSESELINFARDRNIVALGGSRDASGKSEEPQTLVARNLSSLNAALMASRTERIAAESRARSALGENSSEALASAAIGQLRTKRIEAAAEYERLMIQFEPGYPAARAVKQQIDSLDAAISNEVGRINGSRRASFNEALKREAELGAQVERLKGQFDQQQRDTIQYNIYQRDVDTNRQLYDSLLQRYKEIGLSGSVGATNIAIVDPAKVPGGPSAPNLNNYLLMALVGAFGLSIAAIFLLEQIDNGVRSPDDIERLFKLPLLGNVPKSDGDLMAELDDPKSQISEASQSIRAVLAFATSHGLPSTLLVTSAQEGEGKSTTALALAMGISRSGKRVLLIDADMRSPSVHKLVGCSNAKGFSNLLAGDEISPTLFIATKLNGLSVLPAGPKPPSTADLLGVDRLNQLFDGLRDRFDHIMIDAPPILGIADAPILGAMVEGTVLVIEAERTPIRDIRHSLERLRLVNAHVLGAIVTKVVYRRHYGYNYGYGYGYGYGEKDAEG